MITSRIINRASNRFATCKQRHLANVLNQARFFTLTTTQQLKMTINPHNNVFPIRTQPLNGMDVLKHDLDSLELAAKRNPDWASPEDIKKLEFFLEMNSTDDCMHLLRSLRGKAVQDKHITELIIKLLKEDRLEETWYFIEKYSKWNLWRIKIFLNYLDDTNQQYYIIPLANLARQQKIAANSAAWKLILQDRISSFKNPDDYDWWFLSKFLVRVSDILFDTNFFYDRLKKFLGYTGKQNMSFFDRPDSKSETELYSVIQSSYLFASKEPNFNLNFVDEKLLAAYKLFNPKIEATEVIKLKNLLEDGRNEEAIIELKNLESINRFHILPFIKRFCETKDLLGLNDFVKTIEACSALKIRFMALSEYASRLISILPKYVTTAKEQEKNKKSLITILKYLNQQTSINSSIWNKATLARLNTDLNVNLDTLERVSTTELSAAVQNLQD